MADTVGVSRSSVSRQVMEASEAELKRLLERRFDDVKLLVIYIDGIQFGEHVVIGALGVDEKGHKHVLALREGATENFTVAKELLEDLVARGVQPNQKRLFVIDGSKALRAAINAVFGSQQPVQRCRSHKLRNVMDHLPEEQKSQVKSAMRAAYAMTGYAEATQALKRLWRQLCDVNPSAARSWEEGMEETLTLHRLGVSPLLRRSLATTNLIESCLSTVRHVARNVKHWQGGDHVARWTAAGLLEAEKKFRRVQGYRELRELNRVLHPELHSQAKVA